MFLKQTESTYGRLIPKPDIEDSNDEIFTDIPVPIQDQVENLRTKISLKERYLKVINQDVQASRHGANRNLTDLYNETKGLRLRLLDALDAEKSAVQHALRNYPIFQLALRDQTARTAVPWLGDRMFDRICLLNRVLFALSEKRKKLEEAEMLVVLLEKCARPGTLPWEIEIGAEFVKLENKIEYFKGKGEASSILYTKYNEIKYILREEFRKYRPILQLHEDRFETLSKEFLGLQNMLEDSYKFRQEAQNHLQLIEQEAAKNRKQRRKQMHQIKKEVEKLLAWIALEALDDANSKKLLNENLGKELGLDHSDPAMSGTHVENLIRLRGIQIEEFKNKVYTVVHTMRVEDISDVPSRMEAIYHLEIQLEQEKKAKVSMRDTLLAQKAQLCLIQCQFIFKGNAERALFENRTKSLFNAIETRKRETIELENKLLENGRIVADTRLASLGIIYKLNDTKITLPPVSLKWESNEFIQEDEEVIYNLKYVYSKIRKLVRHVQILRHLFKSDDEQSEDKTYENLLKQSEEVVPVPPRLIRVGSPVVSENEDSGEDDEEIIDSKVPGREDIKCRSRRLVREAIIRKGLH